MSRRSHSRPGWLEGFETDSSEDQSDDEALSDESSCEEEEPSRGASRHPQPTQPLAEDNPAGEIAQGWFWEPATGENLKRVKKKRFTGSKQPSSAILQISRKNELDFFFEFLPENFWADVCQASSSPDGTPSFSLADLYQHLAVLIFVGVIGCNVRDVWVPVMELARMPLSEKVSRRVYKQVAAAFRLVREGEVDPADSLSEVRPMIDTLASTCKRNYHPGENLAFDLSTGARGGTSKLLVRTKHNNVSLGVQAWALADSLTGYVYCFELCKDTVANFRSSAVASPGGFSKTEEVLLRCIGSLEENWHCVWLGNLFSRPRLFDYLAKKKVQAIGTWRIKRGVPSLMKMKKLSGKAKAQQREKDPIVMVSYQKAENPDLLRDGVVEEAPDPALLTKAAPLVAASFVDRQVLYFLSNRHVECSKRVPGGTLGKLRLPVQHDYYRFVNGVSTADQLIGNYSTYVRTTKWWMIVFHWLLNVALVNSYISWTLFHEKNSHPQFRAAIVASLLKRADELNSASSPAASQPAEPDATAPPPQVPLPGPVLRWKLTSKSQHFTLRTTGVHEATPVVGRKSCCCCRLRGHNSSAHLSYSRCQKSLCSDCWHIFHTKEDLTVA